VNDGSPRNDNYHRYRQMSTRVISPMRPEEHSSSLESASFVEDRAVLCLISSEVDSPCARYIPGNDWCFDCCVGCLPADLNTVTFASDASLEGLSAG